MLEVRLCNVFTVVAGCCNLASYIVENAKQRVDAFCGRWYLNDENQELVKLVRYWQFPISVPLTAVKLFRICDSSAV